MAMELIRDLLEDPEIGQLCMAAFLDETKLEPALEAIFRKGFADAPYIEGVEKQFARRVMGVREEYQSQLILYREDPDRWEQLQLDTAEDPDAMVCAVSALAAKLYASEDQRAEFFYLLGKRMDAAPARPEQNRELLHQFVQTPASALFVGGRVPEIPKQMLPQAAAILAMCSYVSVKQLPPEGNRPDVSFDAVCVWSNALMDALYQKTESDPSPREAAAVGSVLSAKLMHIFEWAALVGCVLFLPVLAYPVMLKILSSLGASLLKKTGQPLTVRWAKMERHRESFGPWMQTLRDQTREEAAETEAEGLEETTSKETELEEIYDSDN